MKTYIETCLEKATVAANLEPVSIDVATTTLTITPGKALVTQGLLAYASANCRAALLPSFPAGTLQILEQVNAARVEAASRLCWSPAVVALACHVLMASPVGPLARLYNSIPSHKHNALVLQCLYYRLIIISHQFGPYTHTASGPQHADAPDAPDVVEPREDPAHVVGLPAALEPAS
jgi:hypothetical protein